MLFIKISKVISRSLNSDNEEKNYSSPRINIRTFIELLKVLEIKL
jgi:hypothetical protein